MIERKHGHMTTAQEDYRPVAQSRSQQMTTGQLIKALTPEIARALPKGMDADRIARLVMTEIRKNPMLGDCTQQSFAGALLTASALGLEPGVNGECYLVPYRDNKRRVVECQLIVGYQGITKLFWQHPQAGRLSAEWVGANDEFGFTKGLRPELWHHPAAGDRGEPIYYYAIVQIKGAEPIWDVFTPDQIKNLRRGKVGPKGDIPDPERWMERKTALKQVLKLAPKSTRLDMAVRSDGLSGSDLYRSQDMEVSALADVRQGAIEAEVLNGDPTPEHPEIEMVTDAQLTKLAIIRDERYPKTDKGRRDWFTWVNAQIVRDVPIDTNKDLTKHEAMMLLDILEPTETEGN
jgi:recombination protein RecT